MARRYILIKSKKTRKVLGAIPIKLSATVNKIKLALAQLKKDFMAKVVSQATLKRFMVKKQQQVAIKRKPVKRHKVIRRRNRSHTMPKKRRSTKKR